MSLNFVLVSGAKCTVVGGGGYGGINRQGEGGEETTERQVTDKRETGDTTHPRDKNEETVATATLISALGFYHMQTFCF